MWNEMFFELAVVFAEGAVLSVLLYGWLPFLIYGVARRRRGEGGKWQLAVVGIWVALFGAFILWHFNQCPYQPVFYMRQLLYSFLFSVWVPLLIWGIVRRRRKKKGGAWMTAAGGVWCLLAVSVIGYKVVEDVRFGAQVFNPRTYTGAVATVEFPYAREGNIRLTMFPIQPPPAVWFVDAVDTNRMVIPAGTYACVELSVRSEGGKLEFRWDTPFTVTQDEVFTFSDWLPFVASVDVEKISQDRLNLDFSLTDSAGNEVRYRGEGKKIGFEALSPDGEPFWRGDFEWG